LQNRKSQPLFSHFGNEKDWRGVGYRLRDINLEFESFTVTSQLIVHERRASGTLGRDLESEKVESLQSDHGPMRIS